MFETMFELGQVVTIRSDLSADEGNVVSEMVEYAGQSSRITQLVGLHRDLVMLDIDNGLWHWTADMFEPVEEAPKEKAVKYKPEQKKWKAKPLEESVKGAIEAIRNGYYKGTFLKMELEAQLNRGDYEDEGDDECGNCDGEGLVNCEMTHAIVYDDEGNPRQLPWGGDQREDSCVECSDGQVACSYCEGSGYRRSDNDDEWNNGNCHNFIINHVSQACKNATIYSGFVYDGSVDSEFKFTVPLTWEGLGFAIEYIRAFKALARQIGNGLDVQGAGMHITILRSEDGSYPHRNGRIETVPFENFKQNMTKLMPALFLLASEDNKSRGMSYRRPGVQITSHGHAIAGAGSGETGALEWRVFETCYRRPRMLFDFICVIAKGLSYYAPAVEPVKFRSKIGKLEFLDSDSQGLHRYFHTEKHLVALKQGLKYLLPDHRTESEVLRLRNFKVTPQALKRRDSKIIQRLEANWLEYRKVRKAEETSYIERYEREYRSLGMPDDELQTVLERELANYRGNRPATKRDYMKRELERAVSGDRYSNKYSLTI